MRSLATHNDVDDSDSADEDRLVSGATAQATDGGDRSYGPDDTPMAAPSREIAVPLSALCAVARAPRGGNAARVRAMLDGIYGGGGEEASEADSAENWRAGGAAADSGWQRAERSGASHTGGTRQAGNGSSVAREWQVSGIGAQALKHAALVDARSGGAARAGRLRRGGSAGAGAAGPRPPAV